MARIPPLPRWLGFAGLVPQLAALVVLIAGLPEWRDSALTVAVLYPALILSFIGGCWWGIAAGAPAAERRNALGWLWIAAVVPALGALPIAAAWTLGMLEHEAALVMLGAALLLSVGVDARLGPLAPRWWMGLRVPLSLGLGAATLAAAFV